ncbi:RNA polymerase B [Chytridiales sp. JEL 0842]|nr:RNA polymerase B [Chytridiales sp. JEL 0842]
MASRRRKEVGNEDAAECRFGDEFQDVQCLLISEVRVLLEAAEDKKRKDGGVGGMSDIKQKTLDHCQRFSRFTNKQTVKEIRQLYSHEQFHDFEVAQLANLCCETVEEAKSLIQSLSKRFDNIEDAKLQDLLDQMSSLRRYQTN